MSTGAYAEERQGAVAEPRHRPRTSRPTAVSDLDFAAWLEGRLPETAAARIEAAVAADPEMRRAALELADVLGHALAGSPSSPGSACQGAGGLRGRTAEPKRLGLSRLAVRRRPALCLQRAVALTAAVVIAISGFMLGGGLGESLAQERYVSSATPDDDRHQRADRLPGLRRDLRCRLVCSRYVLAPLAAAEHVRSGGLRLSKLDRRRRSSVPRRHRPARQQVTAGRARRDGARSQPRRRTTPALRGVFDQYSNSRFNT